MDIPAACSNARSLLLRSGDLATAPTNYQKAVTIAEALSGADASDRRELSGYAIALMRVENLIPEDGDNPKALAAFSKSIGIMERLADRYPIAGNRAAAIRTCEKSIALGEAPVKADAGRYVPTIWESVRPSLQ